MDQTHIKSKKIDREIKSVTTLSPREMTDTLYTWEDINQTGRCLYKSNINFNRLLCADSFGSDETYPRTDGKMMRVINSSKVVNSSKIINSNQIPLKVINSSKVINSNQIPLKINDPRLSPQCQPFHKIIKNSVDPKVASKADSSPQGYTPAQIRAAYGLNNVTETGKGQKIAIICAYISPTVVNDFIAFDRAFNISPSNVNPATYLTVHTVSGATVNTDWAYEINLDVQWSHAIAPQAQIHLYQAKSAYLSDLLPVVSRAISDGSTLISMSWGCNEFNGQSYYNQYFKTNRNVVFLAASGDTAGTVTWPSSAPTVLSIGGTTLSLNSLGARTSEVGWNYSGGGPSRYGAITLWQYMYGLRGRRQTPDISLAANTNSGFPVYLNNSWVQLIGTSVSTPIMAGILALINEKRSARSKKTLTYLSTPNYLYNLMGKGTYYAINFNDITSGISGSNKAKTGFDNVTGLGTGKNTSSTKGFVYSLFSS